MAIVNFFGAPVALSGGAKVMYKADSLVDGVAAGTDGNEAFLVGPGPYTLIGGGSDDYYYQVSNLTTIVEASGGGVDTIATLTSLVLPDNIENVVASTGGFVGNALNNYMLGSSVVQSFDGGTGDDVLTGGGGGDSFIFSGNSGYDLITDFHAGARTSGVIDTVRLTGYTQFANFTQVQSALTQVGSDVVLTLDSHDAIKFANITIAAFTADNFLLSGLPQNLNLTLSFSEDFSGTLDASGGSTSATKWRTDYGFGGDSAITSRTFPAAGYKQIDVDPTMKGFGAYSDKTIPLNPFSVADGILTIHAAPTPSQYVDALAGYQFTSGVLSTRDSFTQTYGYFEARMELPAGSGAWPAFWLYSVDGSKSELDVMESHSASQWTGATHDYTTGSDQPQGVAVFTPDLSTGFHTYGVLWTAETVTWYLDGVAVKTIDTPAGMHGPMYVMVELALDSTTASTFTGADVQVDYVHAYSLDGSAASVTGGSGADTLTDAAGAQTLTGNAGNDSYYVSNSITTVVEATGGGTDTVNASINYTLGDNVENLVLTGAATTGTGNALNNAITGNALANILTGGAGNDTIDGGAGADTMYGGRGNDVFTVDNAGDRVIEYVGEGTDTVISSIDYVAPANIETLQLTGAARVGTANDTGMTLRGNDLGDTLTGGAGGDQIIGGAGNDRIEGGAGWDKMTGGAGNDVFVVRAGFTGDVITDFDVTHDRIDWSALAKAYPNGPIIRQTAAGDATATFSSRDMITFTGVTAAALIAAKVFANPAAIPNMPAQTLVATSGSDVFTVTSADTVIDNSAAGGSDTLYAYVDYTATAGIKTIALYGAATHAYGNDLDNSLIGNVTGSVLSGGAGNDSLIGRDGADTMYGGAGNDYYVVNNVGDVVIEYANEGSDLISASIDYVLSDNVEKLSLTGTAVIGTGNSLDNTLVGNAVANTLIGGAGNDYIDGGLGADRMVGGTGDDTYIVDNAGDVVVEQANEGKDWITSSVDYHAPANIESLKLVGTATHAWANDTGMSLFGNDLGNWLVGGLGADIITGGKGNDVIIGGAGNDRLIGGGGSDTFVFGPGSGRDTITDFDVINDHVDWSALLAQYGAAPTVSEANGNTVVAFGADTITFHGVHAADLLAHHVL